MSDKILDIFSQYELKARIFPGLITIAPFSLTILIWYPELISFESSFITIFILIIILFFLAKVARERGKKLQTQLLKEWGDFPSVIFLSHTDNTINNQTKKRYHNFLNEHIDELNLPNKKEEIKNPALYREQYKSAVDWLLEKTRDNTKYSLLYQDNINYGFSRNMLGIKPFGIFFAMFSLAIDLFGLYQSHSFNLLESPLKVIISIFLSVFFSLLWLFFVRKKWVESTSRTYARTLLATCEKIT
ncbi:hypothetical protein [Pseudalkalibacillus hwajinpoensis]|uniref:Uncharacterized protein n=1 Tax=Guptibacillus hwajinpoensis TaxID=208199 RepID=A0A4U1M8A7_9BACL|nr:hypothetical protein [Pseudalkalibacillus hwajinpoensis]TKD66455.1 hypothetical protein FBF83_20145 [Pseudalkalibacillus hwajinpoensis]